MNRNTEMFNVTSIVIDWLWFIL